MILLYPHPVNLYANDTFIYCVDKSCTGICLLFQHITHDVYHILAKKSVGGGAHTRYVSSPKSAPDKSWLVNHQPLTSTNTRNKEHGQPWSSVRSCYSTLVTLICIVVNDVHSVSTLLVLFCYCQATNARGPSTKISFNDIPLYIHLR